MDEQTENLSRVSGRIGYIITQFCDDRLAQGNPQFHMDDLRTFVDGQRTVAPASPDRVLRDLRKRKMVNYRVVSRSQSLYEVLA